MKKLNIGDKLKIQCYKHDGKIHRAWDEAVLLDVKKDVVVFGNNRTIVTESEGTSWKTREPAIIFFFNDEWFNIIAQIKKDGVYFYCNIATPFIIEEGTIKYIDYDLDLRIFPSGDYEILDKMEYNFHKKTMAYSKELDMVIHSSMKDLIKKYKNQSWFFDISLIMKYYQEYLDVQKCS